MAQLLMSSAVCENATGVDRCELCLDRLSESVSEFFCTHTLCSHSLKWYSYNVMSDQGEAISKKNNQNCNLKLSWQLMKNNINHNINRNLSVSLSHHQEAFELHKLAAWNNIHNVDLKDLPYLATFQGFSMKISINRKSK